MNKASRRTAGEFIIAAPGQLAALVSPLRQSIIDAVGSAGPLTVAELARLLGKRPSALHHHVALLERVGLLVVAGRSGDVGRPATAYDVPGRPMTLRYDATTARGRTTMRRIVSAMLAAAKDDFIFGFAPGTLASGPTRSLWVSRAEGWLTEAELRRINAYLRRARLLMHSRSGTAPKGARAHSLTFVLSPRETPTE